MAIPRWARCAGILIGMNFRYPVEIPWIVFCVYWAIGALKTRKTVSQESAASRYGILLLEIAGYVLVFSNAAKTGILSYRILPRTYSVTIAGVALTWIGIGLALWARWHLGQNWSARVTLKEGHQLIRTGPYKYFRHPIYSGLDLAAIGAALAINRWRCVAGVCLIVAGYWIKARKEESMLTGQFGEAFREHCRHTGFLIPKSW
jgi:protein-S-isoprenylcysteine O-methyltransferase Ste14